LQPFGILFSLEMISQCSKGGALHRTLKDMLNFDEIAGRQWMEDRGVKYSSIYHIFGMQWHVIDTLHTLLRIMDIYLDHLYKV
jgi:hypothetical protein